MERHVIVSSVLTAAQPLAWALGWSTLRGLHWPFLLLAALTSVLLFPLALYLTRLQHARDQDEVRRQKEIESALAKAAEDT